jgi:hypothetical protein
VQRVDERVVDHLDLWVVDDFGLRLVHFFDTTCAASVLWSPKSDIWLFWGPEAIECGSYVGEHLNADVDGACHPEEAVDCAVEVEPND